MRSEAKKTFYFHASGNSLGGFIEKPMHKIIPSQASVSLPHVGGHATTRSEAFNFEEIVSCRAAYTRVSGGQDEKDGAWSITATTVVEGLKILEVFSAERIVAQLSVEHPYDGGLPKYSFAGSHFDGLKIGGRDASLALNSSLLEGIGGAGASREPITWPLFQKTGRQQAAKLVKSIKGDGDRDAFQWLIDRYGSMASDREPKAHGSVLCSLVDGVDAAIPGRSFGHVIHIPHFGSIFLGEVLASSPTSVQLYSFRAELGCGTSGHVSGPVALVQGFPYP
jgi:hypothetical protein